MTNLLKLFCIALLVTTVGFISCSKKVVKETPTPEPPPPVIEEPPPPPPPLPPVVIDYTAELNALLRPIYFDFDRAELRSEGISTLEQIASFIREHSSVRLMAEGNCDERGSSEYNMGLGEKRAQAVKNYLTNYGIDADRIETTSYGEERLERIGCGQDDDDCHQENRRVEWDILAK